jgi:hypothetical protein
MPDKWAQYAAPASSAPAGDKWAQYEATAAPARQDSAPTDDRNGFQKRVDDAVNTPSATGPRWLDSFGRGAAQAITTPFAHPLETIKGALRSTQPTGYEGAAIGAGGPAVPLVTNALKGVYDDYKQNGLSHALGGVAGGVALGEATGGALGRTVGPVAKMVKSGGAKLDNAVLGTTVGDMEHGANPGAGLSQNRIWGFSQNKLLGGVNRRIPEVTAENRNILAQANPNVLINRGQAVSQPFDDAIKSATNPQTGAALPAQIAKTIKTRNALTNELDPNTGALTTGMRNPYVSPLEAAQLKSNIYGMTDYDNPSRAAFANNALKGAAHNLKDAVETAVPESIPSGQNLHNLMSAKDILKPRVEGTRTIPASKEALLSHAFTGAGTGGAALMDAAGTGGLNLARILRAPLLGPAVGAGGAAASESETRRRNQ